MPARHPALPAPLPITWLISDARNDGALAKALARLPRGSGFIFRHYHLAAAPRAARFAALARLCRRFGHVAVWSGSAADARAAGASGCYGSPALLARGPKLLRLVTAHSLREIRMVRRADAVLLSPVFPTRTHPGGASLGAVRFHLLAARSRVPVIALGGMNHQTARRLQMLRWAAIDGLS